MPHYSHLAAFTPAPLYAPQQVLKCSHHRWQLLGVTDKVTCLPRRSVSIITHAEWLLNGCMLNTQTQARTHSHRPKILLCICIFRVFLLIAIYTSSATTHRSTLAKQKSASNEVEHYCCITITAQVVGIKVQPALTAAGRESIPNNAGVYVS